MAAPFTRFLLKALKDQNQSQRLTMPQFRALDIVSRQPGISLTELADTLGVSKPTTSVFMLRMYQLGLLHKDPHEKRAVRLHLTDKGRAAHDAIGRHLVVELANRLAPLDARELERTRAAVGQLAQLLEP